jgi:predicted Zn-dependent protease
MVQKQLLFAGLGLLGFVAALVYTVGALGERYRSGYGDEGDEGVAVAGRNIRSPNGQRPAPGPSRPDSLELIRRAAEKLHAATQTIDETGQGALALSVDEEMAYGREVHQLILSRHKVYPPAEARERVERLAAPIVRAVGRPEIAYTFAVLENEEVNAFSHLGGFVYVHKGLLDMVQSDDELQFVLAHEIGHVDLGHCVKQLTYTARAAALADKFGRPGEIGVQAIQLAYQLIALGYSEDKEFEADGSAYRSLLALGVGHEEALSFPRRFRDYLAKHAADPPKPKPSTPWEAAAQEVEAHLRTHPPAGERVERLERMKGNSE